jgi:hypothetical protein
MAACRVDWTIVTRCLLISLVILEPKVTAGGSGSEQRRQMQNGDKDANFLLLVGPSEDSVLFRKAVSKNLL